MKVLHILNELKPSGAEIMLEVAGPYWRAQAIDVDMLSLGEKHGSFAPRLEAAGYNITLLPLRFSLSFARQFLAYVRTGRYDVVHLHTEHAKVWIGVLSWLGGVPRLIRTVHNNFPYPKPERWFRAGQRAFLRTLGVQHISISQSVHETELTHLHNPCKLLPNWFNDKHYRPPNELERAGARDAFKLSANDLVIVTVGNCNEIKNHPALLNALSMLPPEYPWRYLHVGAETEAMEERVLARSLGIESRVQFVGTLSDPREAIWAADVYLMPSLREGFSIAALEAIACGLPAVIADVPGLRELVRHFPDILLAAPNPKALSETIALMASEMPIHRESALKRAPRVSERFGVDAGVQRYLNAYMGIFS